MPRCRPDLTALLVGCTLSIGVAILPLWLATLVVQALMLVGGYSLGYNAALQRTREIEDEGDASWDPLLEQFRAAGLLEEERRCQPRSRRT